MGLLSTVQKGRRHKPPRITIYGVPGIGKSTFAASAPWPIFIQTEDGLDEIDCERLPKAESYADVVGALDALAIEEHEYQTVVIDSLDWLERLIWDQVCAEHRVKGIEKVGGGYGKGYTEALDYWRAILARLDVLRDRLGMVVILTAHTRVERYDDPESTSYSQIVPRLHKTACGIVGEWCDATLYATRKIRVQTQDVGFSKKVATAQPVGKDGGDRIIKCVGGPACAAKNRYGLKEELPLSWGAFAEALAQRLTVSQES